MSTIKTKPDTLHRWQLVLIVVPVMVSAFWVFQHFTSYDRMTNTVEAFKQDCAAKGGHYMHTQVEGHLCLGAKK